MKNFRNFFFALVGTLLMIAPASTALSKELNVSNAATSLVVLTVLVVGYVVSAKGAHQNVFVAGIQVEIWVKYIMDRLYKDNAFLKNFYNDDQYVIGGKIVYIPQPGTRPTVVKNRASFPATTVRRTDTVINYTLDEYTTDPTHIQDAEKVELSYDKIDSVLGDHVGYLVEDVADDFLVKVLTGIAAGQKMLTTGGATVATANATATGNRKLMTPADFRRAMTQMNNNNIPKEDRYSVITSNLLDQLIQGLTESLYKNFSEYADAKTGVVGKLFGFNIIERSTVAFADNTNTVKAVGAVEATTDKEIAMFYQKNAIARALGEVKMFENINDPQFYGDVYSCLMRMGGRRRRSDDKGVILMGQDASA